MYSLYNEIVDNVFTLKEHEGRSKVTSLEEAIENNIKPGMSLFVSQEAGAAMCQVLRQFWGTKPEFELIISSTWGTHAANLVHAGLIRKLIFTNCSDFYPLPSPSKVMQSAYKRKAIELENWSTLSFQLRLIAGALGTNFFPTKSIVGSSMADDNSDSFTVIDNPFKNGDKIGLVKSLNPDIAIVHGWAADCYGNTITNPFFLENSLWGARASTNGVIVTVEKVVSTEYVRQHSPLVRIAGHLVKSVSLVPFGAHPLSMHNHFLKDFDGYGQDDDFLVAFKKASRHTDMLDRWIKDWVLNCTDHEDYLNKLGHSRILKLKALVDQNVWKQNLQSVIDDISSIEECGSNEMMIVAASRYIRKRVIKTGCKIIFGGIGIAGLACWVAFYQLRSEGYDIDLVPAGIGFAPRPGDPFLLNPTNIPTAKMFSDPLEIHGAFVSGTNNSCFGVLGVGQIDKYGNINSTKISDEIYLSGSGGGNDIASGAREIAAVAYQSTERFVENVSYITCPGEKIRALISNKGIFEKLEGDNEFTLTGYLSNNKFTAEEEIIKDIKNSCGWRLKVSPDLEQVSSLLPEELAILRLLDPRGNFRDS